MILPFINFFLFFSNSGISSLVFTKDAQALYLHSSSELQRISLSATAVTMARCYLPLPSGVNGGGDREETASDGGSDRNESTTDAPLVNGTAGSKDGSLADKVCCINVCFFFNIFNIQPLESIW